MFETAPSPSSPSSPSTSSPPSPSPDDDVPQVNTSKLSSTSHTHKKFADASLSTANVDLSGSIRFSSSSSSSSSPLSNLSHYALGPPGPTSSLLERYHALQSALAVLENDVDALGKAGKGDDTVVPATPDASGEDSHNGVTVGDLHASLRGLAGQLASLKSANPKAAALLDESLAVQGSIKAQEAGSELLMAKLAALQAAAEGGDGKDGGENADAEGNTVELYYRPQLAALNHQASMGEVARRLADLERIVGPPAKAEADDGIGAGKKGKGTDLVQTVSALDKRLTLLDDDELKGLQRRLTSLSAQLDDVLEKHSAASASSAFEDKLNVVYSKMEAWDAMAPVIPSLIDRLHTLSALHQDAATFGNQLAALADAQADLTAALSSNESLLNTVSASLAENMSSISENIQSIEARIAALE